MKDSSNFDYDTESMDYAQKIQSMEKEESAKFNFNTGFKSKQNGNTVKLN